MEKKEFIEYLNTFTEGERAYHSLTRPKRFFRVNSLKISLKEFLSSSKIKRNQTEYWENAFSLEEDIQIGRTWEYFLGYLHPQSMASMIPPIVLNPKPKESVLDITAAPGSKTTQMSAMMKNTGMILANDKKERLTSLMGNITRLGVINTISTAKDAKKLKIRNRFDRALLDAPCTALGGEKFAHLRYDYEMSKRISVIQKTMILNTFDSLKEGGTMVYSTCTFSSEENEGIVEFLLHKREEAELQNIELEIPHEKGFGMEKAWRIYPQHLESEGFFIAKIRRGKR
ncbi:NOL1/NOP2/sun family putative RNA methylase [Candidatus Micrarchaeota archaeon]|nr:NOL1/NOP2/sun family putative RNA methylase [Candidatus Micrarchaeota archaeon]